MFNIHDNKKKGGSDEREFTYDLEDNSWSCIYSHNVQFDLEMFKQGGTNGVSLLTGALTVQKYYFYTLYTLFPVIFRQNPRPGLRYIMLPLEPKCSKLSNTNAISI